MIGSQNKKLISLFTLIVLFSPLLKAQEQLKRNATYVELGGNGLLASINYERQIFKNMGLGVHAGIGMYGLYQSFLTFPVGLNYLVKFPESNCYLDVGAGVTYSRADVKMYVIIDKIHPDYKQTNYWNFLPRIGIQNISNNNFTFRFTFSPVINHWGFIPSIGIAVGKRY